ncbi:MAG: type II CAAX prenyl endopeptidase Rce1 family protein [Bradymonadaceae bacterium]
MAKKAGQKQTGKRGGFGSSGLAGYHRASRDLWTSLILVMPLFIAYQIGVMATGGIRNGVDFMTDLIWWSTGSDLGHYLIFNLALIAIFGGVIFAYRKRGTFRARLWPWVMLESTVYAIFLGGVVIGLMQSLGLGVLLSTGVEGLELNTLSALVLSIGAGLYEELVFRLIMMGGLFYVGRRLLKLPRWVAAVGALLISSLAFSAVHHIGSLGEDFVLGVFMFRFFAGMVLAGIFYARGFAVAVYTHAIYDVIVLVLTP